MNNMKIDKDTIEVFSSDNIYFNIDIKYFGIFQKLINDTTITSPISLPISLPILQFDILKSDIIKIILSYTKILPEHTDDIMKFFFPYISELSTKTLSETMLYRIYLASEFFEIPKLTNDITNIITQFIEEKSDDVTIMRKLLGQFNDFTQESMYELNKNISLIDLVDYGYDMNM